MDYSNLNYAAKGFWTIHFSLPGIFFSFSFIYKYFLYLFCFKVSLNESQERFVDDLVEHLSKANENRKVAKLEEFHVTLTKTFQVKQSVARSLVDSLESELNEKLFDNALKFRLDGLRLLPGKNLNNFYQKELDTGYFDNKTFVAFEVKPDAESLNGGDFFRQLNERLVKCLRANKLSPQLVFTDPSYLYHVSVAWINESMDNLDSQAINTLIDKFQSEQQQQQQRSLDFNLVDLNRLKLKIGNKIHFFFIY